MQINLEPSERERCSLVSSGLEEPLFATASQAEVWFLLEHPSPWGSKAFEESQIPFEVKDSLFNVVKEVSNSKLLLIKRKRGPNERAIKFYIAVAREIDPFLIGFDLDSYQELLDMDIPRQLSRISSLSDQAQNDPLFLVCTNGKRDPCCSRFGLEVYSALNGKGLNVWQMSHVGGHRFAANVLCLPNGILYGRVRPDDIPEIIEQYQKNSLLLDHYRGRTCYPQLVQAAEFFLRKNLNFREIFAVRLENVMLENEDDWKVIFRNLETGDFYSITLRIGVFNYPIKMSCADQEKKPIETFQLLDIN